MACVLLLSRVAPSSCRLLRTCICFFSLFMSYLCYCILFSSDTIMQKSGNPTPNCRRIQVDGGKRLLQKSFANCALPFNARENTDVSRQKTERKTLSRLSTVQNNTPSPSMGNVKFGNKKLPNAIIVGVKKGGTRAVLEFIRIHPDVRAVGTETHFFDRNYDRGLDWYRWESSLSAKVYSHPCARSLQLITAVIWCTLQPILGLA